MRKLLTLSGFILSIVFSNNTLAQDNVLTVGMECNYAPFNWTQTEKTDTAVELADGFSYCDGYDVQIAKIIANKLNKKLVIKTNPVFEALLTDVQLGNIDLIIAGMSDTPKRRSAIDFSDVYFQTELVLVVKKDSKYATATSLEDFTKASVSAQLGTFHVEMIEQIPEVSAATPLQSFPVLTLALKSNTIDAFVSENAVAISIVKSNPELTYITFAKDKGFKIDAEEVTVSIGMAKGQTELQKQVNAVLAELSPEQRTKIMEDAIARQPN